MQEGEAPAAVDKQEAVAACPTAASDSAKRALPSPALVSQPCFQTWTVRFVTQ